MNNTIDWLSLIKDLPEAFDGGRTMENPHMKSAAGLEQNTLVTNAIKSAKYFSLDIEQVQNFYLKLQEAPIHEKVAIGELHLPFDNCLIAFKKPFLVRWNNGIGKDYKSYVQKPLVGFTIRPFSEAIYRKLKYLDIQKDTTGSFQTFEIILFFLENPEQEFSDNNSPIIGTQVIFTKIATVFNNPPELAFLHVRHYPCSNPMMCIVAPGGEMKFPNVTKAWVCDDIVVRDALLHSIHFIFSQLSKPTSSINKKPNFQVSDQKISLPKDYKFEAKQTKIPVSGYASPIKEKNYKYAPEDIAYGTGTKHRFQYDVRRHARIVGDKIVWVNPYLRGTGEYTPKTYTNSKTWFIDYLVMYTERMTKYRWFEKLLIKTIKLARRLHL